MIEVTRAGRKDVRTFPWWRRISIHTRLQSSIIGFSFVVLCICALSLTWAANSYFHKKIHQDLTTLALVFARNLRAAVIFDDTEAAINILSTLRENPNIEEAAIFKEEALFAAYPNTSQTSDRVTAYGDEGTWLNGDHYLASVVIDTGDDSSARLVFVSGLSEWKEIQEGLYYLFTGLFVGLLCLTLLLSVWLKRHVSRPIEGLSDWAKGVSRNQTFNVRAVKHNDDEIGALVDSLNEMLSELAKQKSIMSWNEQLQNEIKERKRIEVELIETRDRAESAFQAKSRFLANMSHEIRTPMNAIIGFINIILEGPLNDEQRKQLNTVKRSAKSLHSLLNDILDVAKLEQEKFELESIPFSPAQVIDDVIEVFAIRAKEEDIVLERKIADDVPPAVYGDPYRLTQVLSNLVGNALKFTQHGRVDVTLANRNNQYLVVKIKDTGIGIPKDKQKHIFKSFGQADNSTSRRFGGTGLGTTISKQLVELMGGEIGFDSEEGVGSTFYFTIKMKLANPDDLVDKEDLESSQPVSLDPKKMLNILVVEDIVENAELLKARLGSLGHHLAHAINGREAIEIFAKQDFDIILMDVHMPEVDGLTATRAIRATDRGAQLPILALSASVLKEDRMDCAKAGMNGFVAKPIMFDELFSEMARLLAMDSDEKTTPAVGTERTRNFPTVPGIDFKKAVDNWQDERVYIRNLQGFFSKHQQDIPAIRDSLKRDDITQSRQIIHGLHGVVGNLSLDTLYDRLKDLSTAIRKNQRELLGEILDDIDKLMLEAKDSAQRLCALYNIGTDGGDTVDRIKLAESIHSFERDLARGQLNDELLPKLIHELRSSGASTRTIDAIEKAIDEFEFDKARTLLQNVQQQIKAHAL